MTTTNENPVSAEQLNSEDSQKELDLKAALQHMSDVYHYAPPDNVIAGDHAIGAKYSHLQGYSDGDAEELYRAYYRRGSRDDDEDFGEGESQNTAPTTYTSESHSTVHHPTSPAGAAPSSQLAQQHHHQQTQSEDVASATLEHMSNH
jgi:hypothetical protein